MKWKIYAAAFVFAGLVCMAGVSKRMGGGEKDVVEAYYADLVDKSSELKQLEKEITNNERNVYEMESRFNAYNRPSTEYYSDAARKVKGIHNETLKTLVNGWLDNSKSQYYTRIADLNKLIATLSEKRASQEDYHLAVKIAMTLPIIEKYQQEKLPADGEYQRVLNELDATIKKLQASAKK